MALTRMRIAVLVCAIVALLAYLRDPPWLLSYTYGLRSWETDADGRRLRWTGGHSSFHVPADVRSVTIPLRSFRETPSDWPITAVVTIDDRAAERVTFHDDSWRLLTLRLPPRGNRRTRRIDIKLDRLHRDNRGIQLGDALLHR